jgi:hypothetical protein
VIFIVVLPSTAALAKQGNKYDPEDRAENHGTKSGAIAATARFGQRAQASNGRFFVHKTGHKKVSFEINRGSKSRQRILPLLRVSRIDKCTQQPAEHQAGDGARDSSQCATDPDANQSDQSKGRSFAFPGINEPTLVTARHYSSP